MSTKIETRVLPHAYICGNGCVREPSISSWATMTQLYLHRPDGCRFGVAQLHDDTYGCYDFYSNRFSIKPVHGTDWNATPLWSADNPDALVMKAMALYDRTPDEETCNGPCKA